MLHFALLTYHDDLIAASFAAAEPPAPATRLHFSAQLCIDFGAELIRRRAYG